MVGFLSWSCLDGLEEFETLFLGWIGNYLSGVLLLLLLLLLGRFFMSMFAVCVALLSQLLYLRLTC
jgi:hypothetical protein